MNTATRFHGHRTVALVTAALLALPALMVSGASAATVSSLTPGTASMLQSLAVDEKLAHDAYAAFGDRYDVPIFDNIAEAETRHQQTVRDLLTKHAIADPTAGDPVGSFDDPSVQALYNGLVARGQGSVTAALEVGIEVEGMQIAQLDRILAADIPRDVRQVSTNLLDASRNHRAAFAEVLASTPPATPPSTTPSPGTAQRVQSAEVRAQVSGRYRVGDTLVLAARPAKTDVGVTVRWRATVESRNVCTVRTMNGRATVTLLRPGTCRVIGFAPAPSPEYNAYRVQRTYRAVR